MKKSIKAFTIVELVIVIAVIAILAAVLIPTFGGVIKNANKSADESEAASLNTQLAITNINGEEDLYALISEVYGETTAKSFAPRSAKYGYHYWYDVQNNRIILSTYNGLPEVQAQPEATAAADESSPTLCAAALAEEDETTFKDIYKDSFRMFNENYYILDRGGSVIGEALEALSDGKDIAKKLNALKAVKNSDKDLKAMADAILKRLPAVAIVSDEMTFVYDADSVKALYFVPGIETISSNISSVDENKKPYIAKAENVQSVNIPSTVKKVEEGALVFFKEADETVWLNTTLTSASEVAEVFEANSTNGKIVCGEVKYTIDKNVLTGSDGSSAALEFGNQVTDFDIILPQGDTFCYVSAGNTLYVAHSAGEFSLEAGNFRATKDNETVVTDVIWSCEGDGSISVDDEGKVTINTPEKYNESLDYAGKVTVKSITNAEAEKELNVFVVTVLSATVNVGTNQLLLDNTAYSDTLTLTYDGTAATAEYAISEFGVIYNVDGDVLENCCDSVSPEFTTSGGLFTIADGKLKLNLNADNLNGTQTFTVKVGEHIEKTFTVTVVDNSATTFEKVFANNYLYRLGNSNAVTLGQLFTSDKPGNQISVAIYDASIGESKTVDELVGNHLTATYTKTGLTTDTWAESTIDFGGTGVAIIKITNEAGTQKVIVEVVDGYNITDESQLKNNANNILISDIKLASGGSFSLSGNANNHKTLYGNGFTFDITDAKTTGNGIITLSNADIDNIKIKGAIYETYADSHGTAPNLNEYYASAILVSSGSSRISNSYIFGCRSNVRINGDLEIVNTVLECARLANVHVAGGTLTIDGLTTINEPRAENKNVMGLGIAIGNDANNTAKINVKGSLKQYNWLRESDESYLPDVTGMSTLVDKIFAETKYLHDIGGVKYVNMGIACLTSEVTTSVVTFSNSDNAYEATNISALGFTGFIISITDAKYDATTADLNYRTNAYAWAPTAQSNTTPTINWNKYSGGKADVSFERGQSFEFDPNVMTATKHGNTIIPSVTINGVDYTGEKITFTEDQTCTIKYTLKDSYVYDASGNVIEAVTYEYYLVVNVTTTIPEIKAPEFSFGNASGYTEVKIGDKIYINPTPTDASKFETITVNGTNIYAPIVELAYKDNSSDFTPYYPIFGGGLTITWYNESGTATTYSSSSNLSALPSGLEWITQIASVKGGVSDWNGYGKYSTYGLCRVGANDGSTNNTTTYKSVEFSFQAEGTEKYYYYVRFQETAHKCPSSCVTPDTLVTLADGTKKEIQHVTYEDQLLVWNHFTGKYEVVPSAIIFNHGYDNNTVIKLNFSDGTQVKAINLHQFLEADLKRYVSISAETVSSYVGHNFVKQNGDGYTTVTLESYEISEEYIEAYGIISALHYNILVEGMFSTDFMENDYDLFNCFAIGEGMVFDAEKMQKDIEEYGLYTYEEFADYLTCEQFVGFNVQYFKIAVGKGLYTYQGILDLIEVYLDN